MRTAKTIGVQLANVVKMDGPARVTMEGAGAVT